MSKRQELLDFIARAGWDGAEMVEAALREAADNRAHAEAEKLRNEAKLYERDLPGLVGLGQDVYLRAAGNLAHAAGLIDPYEERDGQLVRKSDGKPVIL